MICKPCRDAASYLAAVDLSYDYITAGDIEQALEDHAECKGGTWCDCHHQIPAWVPKRMENA
jgi:hypothetical protein